MCRQKRRCRKTAVCLLLAFLIMAWPIQAFASKTAEIPVYMAYAVMETIDVTVTSKIQLSGNNLSTRLEVTDMVVTNNSTSTAVQIDSLEVGAAESPWQLVADSTDFAGLAADTCQFSLVADGHDLSQSAYTPAEKQVEAGSSKTIELEGQCGVFSESMLEQKTATLLITISEVEASPEMLTVISGTVPEGGLYLTSGGETLSPGDPLPSYPSTGDMLQYGDYNYRYNAYHGLSGLEEDTMMRGWNAQVKDTTAAAYGVIAEEIIGKAVNSLGYCFMNCTVMVTAPAIPESILYMENAFLHCYELTGEIEINTDIRSTFNCFLKTKKPIVITGSCSESIKQELAATSEDGNVTYTA